MVDLRERRNSSAISIPPSGFAVDDVTDWAAARRRNIHIRQRTMARHIRRPQYMRQQSMRPSTGAAWNREEFVFQSVNFFTKLFFEH
jgi:hypothetical protein